MNLLPFPLGFQESSHWFYTFMDKAYFYKIGFEDFFFEFLNFF